MTERTTTDRYVMGSEEIDASSAGLVGGKGAHLGELARIDDVRVPGGFCVTTEAFRVVTQEVPGIDARLERLSTVGPGDAAAIRTLSADLRRSLDAVAVPDAVEAAITRSVEESGEHATFAVRSSATAEDLPSASFAGLHDTYLHVDRSAVLGHVRRCWASLFTERAVTYRLRNGFDHRRVRMAVVVQPMVRPRAAGTLFTADPLTSNRKVVTIEAVAGPGDALVAGLVRPDTFEVRGGHLVPDAGTTGSQHRRRATLSPAEALRLARLGRRIEAHFARPQDIEWCLVDDDFWIVQSRPITTLFPIPPAPDGANHVYVSVGHQQMMTEPMKPLGLSIWQLTALRPMTEAGGRLFVDVTRGLASPASRAGYLEALGTSDPLTGDALQSVVDRGDFIPALGDAEPAPIPVAGTAAPPLDADPAIVAGLVACARASLATLQRDIPSRTGVALLDFIASDLQELKAILSAPRSVQVIRAAIDASLWLDTHLREWLGEEDAAATLSESVPGNVSSEMGLALLDLADVIRPHPDVVDLLEHVEDDRFLDRLQGVSGGREASDAIAAYLDAYGMRCAGEIDITRPRWSEAPTALVPLILSHVKGFGPGAAARRFERGRAKAQAKREEVLVRLRALPGGAGRAAETEAMIDRLRTYMGYREYPKYHMVSRYAVYRRALLGEADRLVRAGVLAEREDAFYLRFEELRDVVRTNRVDTGLLRRRRDDFRSYQALDSPRVLTSDGEVLSGSYRRHDTPAGALVGLPVSAGTVEGRARVVGEMSGAELEAGDILVTTGTDPSWTPAFVTVGGLVTEVGGRMTHGAVIAREYGLPAVVGVEHATRLIRDGQRIRVHGTEGYVEILA